MILHDPIACASAAPVRSKNAIRSEFDVKSLKTSRNPTCEARLSAAMWSLVDVEHHLLARIAHGRGAARTVAGGVVHGQAAR